MHSMIDGLPLSVGRFVFVHMLFWQNVNKTGKYACKKNKTGT